MEEFKEGGIATFPQLPDISYLSEKIDFPFSHV
jgi:hypothetical protein